MTSDSPHLNSSTSPPIRNESFLPPSTPKHQDMEGIQMVMASLEAANLSMSNTMNHEPNGAQIPCPKLSSHAQQSAAIPFPNDLVIHHPNSAATSPPSLMYHFPGADKTLDTIHSTLVSPVSSTFNHIQTIPSLNNTLTNGQSSEESAIPSGYVTPQSSGCGPAGLVDFSPNGVHQNSLLISPSGVGEDRNLMILDLARRLHQSVSFLTQAVQQGKDAEVETHLANVDQLAALMSPFRKNGPPIVPGRMDSISSPLNKSMLPPPLPLNQHSPPPSSSSQSLTSNGIHNNEELVHLQSRPPSPRNNMMGLLLDNEASRKRCASAVTDGDRVIKSLKIETHPQQQPPGASNTSLIGIIPPPPLQLGMNDMPPPSSIGPLSSTAFMTPLTPSSNDHFFGQPPLTPASSIPSHSNLYGFAPSNPPSAPCSRPPSPNALRRGIPPPSMVHQQSPPRSFTRGLSWSDLSVAATSPAQPYAAFTNVSTSNVPTASAAAAAPPSSSYTPSTASTPARARTSRSSSYSGGLISTVSQVVVPSDRVMVEGTSLAAGGYAPITTKIEEHDMDAYFVSGVPYRANFSISAPHSPHSSSSDESFDISLSQSPPVTKMLPHTTGGMVTPAGLVNGHQPSSSIDSSVSVDEFAEVNHIPNPNHPGNEIPPEYKHEVERIFFEFLNRICSNLEATDAKGELIHQTLMAKKMQRLDESPDFRPFKFRIQAFTNAFLEELAKQGYPEDKLPMKKVRGYLWIQPFISRYNEDGKKAKSKGNHIWNIDAKKLPEGGWIFRRFHRKIAGSPPGVAYQGLQWSYKPHIWDPQQSRKNENVHYSSPWLPSWLRWDRDTLVGTPPEDADSVDVTVEARFTENGIPELLTTTFHLTVAPINAGDVNSMNALGLHSRSPVTGDNGLVRRVNSDTLVPSFATLGQRPPLPRQTTMVNVPPVTGSSRVVEVLNDAVNRVIQDQSVAAMNFAEPQIQASLARQHQVLTVTCSAVEGTSASPFDHRDIQANAIANVGTQFIASTVDVLMQERRSNPTFSLSPEPNLTVSEVSEVTQKAIAQAVDILPPSSSDVEVLMAAKAYVQSSSRVTGNNHHHHHTHSHSHSHSHHHHSVSESQLLSKAFVPHAVPVVPDMQNFSHGPSSLPHVQL